MKVSGMLPMQWQGKAKGKKQKAQKQKVCKNQEMHVKSVFKKGEEGRWGKAGRYGARRQ